MRLVEFRETEGMRCFVNPEHVANVCEPKHGDGVLINMVDDSQARVVAGSVDEVVRQLTEQGE